jgi:Protein of unknown function (DUF1579)
MKIRTILFALLLIAAIAAPGAAAPGQEKAKTPAMTQEQMMAQMMKYANPVKEHEYLKKYVGDWDAEVKAWSQPGAEPTISKGAMKGELLYEGRYVKTEFESTMMNMPFKGMQILGYDLFKKKYTAIWLDNMSTHFSPTTGALDPAGKILTETGVWPDPMTGGTSKVKIVTTWLAEGKYRFDMFMIGPDGKEIKSMEITYTKRGM